jgi:hypothetical protein
MVAETLTFIQGLGGTLARRLREAGISDIEDLASAEPDDLTYVRGVSRARGVRWIEEASDIIRTRSAFAFREIGTKLRTTVSDWPEDIDQYRLRRALDLTVRQQADYFLVSGGLEPHRVRSNADKLLCDCVDFANGKNCKHALAVRFAQRDQVLVSLVERLESDSTSNELDLYKLWFEGGKQ